MLLSKSTISISLFIAKNIFAQISKNFPFGSPFIPIDISEE